MTREQTTPIEAAPPVLSATGAVLRGVVMAGEARALGRPRPADKPAAPQRSATAPAPQAAMPPVQAPSAPAQRTPAYSPQAVQRSDADNDYQERGRGFRAGYEEGRQQGHAEGLQAGLAQGREEGREEGRIEGQKEGFNTGLEQGRQAGQQAVQEAHAPGRQALAQRVRGLDALLALLPEKIDRALADAEDEMLGLCFDVLASILGEAAVSRDGVRGMVRHAIAQTRGKEAATVHVNPRDLELLQTDEELAAWLGGNRRIHWIGDDRVELGGCLVFTADGGLDARLETQLARLATAFAKVRREKAAPTGGGRA